MFICYVIICIDATMQNHLSNHDVMHLCNAF